MCVCVCPQQVALKGFQRTLDRLCLYHSRLHVHTNSNVYSTARTQTRARRAQPTRVAPAKWRRRSGVAHPRSPHTPALTYTCTAAERTAQPPLARAPQTHTRTAPCTHTHTHSHTPARHARRAHTGQIINRLLTLLALVVADCACVIRRTVHGEL